MILSLLWLASLVKAATPDGRTRRVHELRGRLGAGPAPRARSSVKTRLAWACAKAPAWAGFLTLQANKVGTQGQIDAGLHSPGMEALLPWLAQQLVSPRTRLQDLPWAWMWASEGLGLDYDLPLAEGWTVDPDLAALFGPPHPPMRWAHVGGWLHHTKGLCGYIFLVEEPALSSSGGTTVRSTTEMVPMAMLVYLCSPGARAYSAALRYVFLEDLLGRMVDQILDWIVQTHPDLSRFSLVQAWDACRTWHEAFAYSPGYRTPIPLFPEDIVERTYPDGSTLVQIRSRKGLEAEGVSMGHCVGGYWADVRDGRSEIWSLRDPKRVPLLTAETDPENGDRILQVHGPMDVSPGTLLHGTNLAAKQAVLRMAAALPGADLDALRMHFSFPAVLDPNSFSRLLAALGPQVQAGTPMADAMQRFSAFLSAGKTPSPIPTLECIEAGAYPSEPLPDEVLDAWASFLSTLHRSVPRMDNVSMVVSFYGTGDQGPSQVRFQFSTRDTMPFTLIWKWSWSLPTFRWFLYAPGLSVPAVTHDTPQAAVEGRGTDGSVLVAPGAATSPRRVCAAYAAQLGVPWP